MTDASSDKLFGDDCNAILTAIAKLADRIERRSDEVERCSGEVERRSGEMARRLEQPDRCSEPIENRFDRIDDDMKAIKADLLEIKLLVRNLPTYWHMYVALIGFVVTVFSLMHFAMPGH
jgi:predicted translin family RNA/ssDNA-binding protein